MSTHWKIGKLSDLVIFQRGFDITKAEQVNGNIPIISSSGITSFHNKAKQMGPAVIIGRKGTLGSVHYYHKEYWPHDTTLWSKELKGDPKFIYYFLKTMKLEQYDVGNANPTLNRNHIHKLNIPIPPLSTQQKTAHILSAYDDLIENNLKRIKLLEEIVQITYEEWFVRMKFPGHEQAVIDSETGLPEGWMRKKAQDELDINIGRTPSRSESMWFTRNDKGVNWASIKDMKQSSTYIFETNEKITSIGVLKHNMNIAKAGTVLLSFKLTVGEVVITTKDMVSNEAIAHMNIKSSSILFDEYIFLYLKSFNFDSLGSTSSIGAAINSKIVKVIPFVIPSVEVLNYFKIVIQPIFYEIKNLQKQSQLLKEARDILLPRLMTGMIDVNTLNVIVPTLQRGNADGDAPASRNAERSCMNSHGDRGNYEG